MRLLRAIINRLRRREEIDHDVIEAPTSARTYELIQQYGRQR